MGFLSNVFSIFTNTNDFDKKLSHFEETNEKTEEKFVKEAIERAEIYDKFHYKKILKFDYNNLINIPLDRELNYLEKNFLLYISDFDINDLIHLPLYWTFEYNIDYKNLINIFISNGYLEIQNYRNNLNKLLVNELKEILKKSNLKTTGKKDELIKRIEENISKDKLKNFFCSTNKFLILTEKGKNAVKNIPVSATKDIDFEDEQLELIKNKEFTKSYENIGNREKKKPIPDELKNNGVWNRYYGELTKESELRYYKFYDKKILTGENEKYNTDFICSLILGNMMGLNPSLSSLIFLRLTDCKIPKKEVVNLMIPYNLELLK